MGTGGCLVTSNIAGQYTWSALNVNFSGTYQRYGQFALQFIDYNENKNDDVGNEDRDGSGNIMGDDDDKNLWMGPDPIGTGAYKELYLIKKNERGKYERLMIRWYVKQDPDVLYGATCDFSGPSPTGSGCLWNVQILRLMGEDFGLTHDGNGNTAYDGKIDTWFCHIDWKEQCQWPDVLWEKLPAGIDSEWVNVFPEFINVKNIEFYLAPKNDSNLAWWNGDLSDYIHPYVRLRVTLGFSWERKKLLHLKKMEDMDMTISTTINLNEFDL